MKTLIKHLLGTAECLSQTLSENAAEMMLDELSSYPAEQVIAALRDCRRTLESRLTLSAILKRLKQADGHPEPNEAWLLALAASSGSSKQPLTAPIQQAFKLAKVALDMGDKTGARMGFIETYQRLVAEARAQHKAADWQALPEPKISETGQQNALPKPDIDPQQARDNLQRVRSMLVEALSHSGQQKSAGDEQRKTTQQARAKHFAQLEQHARDLKRKAAFA